MPTTCLVDGCKTGKNGNSARTFPFPKCENMKKKWLKQLQKTSFQLKSHHRICINHFASDSFKPEDQNTGSKKRKKVLSSLKENAYPTLELSKKREHSPKRDSKTSKKARTKLPEPESDDSLWMKEIQTNLKSEHNYHQEKTDDAFVDMTMVGREESYKDQGKFFGRFWVDF